MRKLIVVLAVLLLVGLPLISACGGDEEEATPIPTPTPLTTEQIVQRTEERFAEVLSYRTEFTMTLEPLGIPVVHAQVDVQVGEGGLTTMEYLDPDTGEVSQQVQMLFIGADLYYRTELEGLWYAVPEATSEILALGQSMFGEDFQGPYGEPVPVFGGVREAGGTFEHTVVPDSEFGEAYEISFAVDPERHKEKILEMMRQQGQELPADVARVSTFDMKGTVWVTTADFLVRKQDTTTTVSIPGSPTIETRIEALLLDYDKPVSIEAPASAETLPYPTPPPMPTTIPTPTARPPASAVADGNLEAAIRIALDKEAGEEITTSELAELTSLDGGGRGISNLSGIERCINLTSLWLGHNQITDISPLSSHTSLTRLDLGSNQISDISPLVENSGLGDGDEVWLEDNNLDLWEGSEDLEDIRALENRGVEVTHDPIGSAP